MKLKMKHNVFLISLVIMSLMIIQDANSNDNLKDINTTKISELKNYQNSYIKGQVIKILDEDEFRLEDSSGKIKVYTGWKNTFVVDKGENITVKGKLDPGIIKEFYATQIIRENGEVITLESGE